MSLKTLKTLKTMHYLPNFPENLEKINIFYISFVLIEIYARVLLSQKTEQLKSQGFIRYVI